MWKVVFSDGSSGEFSDDQLNMFNDNDIKSAKPITETSEQMRQRAKTEFAQDMEAQKQAELDSRFDTPLGKVIANLLPRSAKDETANLETFINAGKDVTSLPGRFAAEGIGSLAEALGTAYSNTGNPKYIDQEISKIGSRFMDNVGNIEGQPLVESIVTDPLLPVLGGVNAISIPGRAMMSGLARLGTGSTAIVANEYAKPGEMSIEENAAPIVSGLVLNALPELKLLKGVVDKLKGRHELIGGAKTFIQEPGESSFLLAKNATTGKVGNIPTKAPIDQLRQAQDESRIINYLTDQGKQVVPVHVGMFTDITGLGSGFGTIAGMGTSTLMNKIPTQTAAQKGMGLLSGLLDYGSRIPRTSVPVVDNTRVRIVKRD